MAPPVRAGVTIALFDGSPVPSFVCVVVAVVVAFVVKTFKVVIGHDM